MCGLAGVAGSYLTSSDIDAFEDLLLVSSLRGFDSTGVAIIRKIYAGKVADDHYDATVFRQASHAWDFLCAENYKKHIRSTSGSNKAFLGHCRHATKGKVTIKNAHPFIHKHIVGMHNGTIEGTFDYRDDFDTDSEALFYNIMEKGAKAALEHINLRATHTAYALSWYNTAEKTLNFIRNSQRPLWFATNKVKDRLYWASEPIFLDLMEDRNPVVLEKAWELATNTLFTLDLSEGNVITSWSVKKDFLELPKTTVVGYGAEWKGWSQYDYDEKTKTYTKKGPSEPPFQQTVIGSTTTTGSTTAIEEINKQLSPLLKKFETKTGIPIINSKSKEKKLSPGSYNGFKNIILSKELATTYLNKGCAWCSSPKSLADPVRWIGISEFVCESCKLDPFVLEYIESSGKQIGA